MLPDINNSQLKRIQPSLFGVYPTLPEGELVQVWANAVSYTHLTLPTICSV